MGEAIARIDELRDRFALARKRLESLPEIGLSEDGLPFIREVAEVLQSFAEWFGNLTLDEMSLSGSAYKVLDTVNGLDAIADWVGLHCSQQFAADIREHVGELVEESETLDAAVSAAFTVKRTPSEVVKSRNRRVPQAKRDAIEDGIQSVASLAGHLAVRLQRIAAMTASSEQMPRQTSSAKQKKRRDRKGIGGTKKKYPEQFVREVLAARRREEKACRKSKDRLPPKNEWLRLYCQNRGIDTAKMFPPFFDGEPWDLRANRFWKAAAAREKRAGN